MRKKIVFRGGERVYSADFRNSDCEDKKEGILHVYSWVDLFERYFYYKCDADIVRQIIYYIEREKCDIEKNRNVMGREWMKEMRVKGWEGGVREMCMFQAEKERG